MPTDAPTPGTTSVRLEVEALKDKLREPWPEPWDDYAWRADALAALAVAERLLIAVESIDQHGSVGEAVERLRTP